METETNDVENTEPTTTVEVPEQDAAPEQEDQTPVDRPSRKERREAKKFDFQAELRTRDERLEQERNERQRLSNELAEIRGRLSERESATGTKDKYADEIAKLEEAADRDLKTAAAAMERNPAEAERLVKEHNKKQRQIARLEFKQEQDSEKAEEAKRNPPLSQQEREDGQKVIQEFQWIMTNSHARAIMDDLISRMTGQGAPKNYATFKAAAAYVANALNLGGHQAPTNEQKQRYNGVGAGEGSGGNGMGSRKVEMGKHEIALARALANREGKGATDEEARENWAKRVGSRIGRND